MSESTQSPHGGPTADLQFEHAEVAAEQAGTAPAGLQCASCSAALDKTYFAIGEGAFCGTCKDEVVAAIESRTRPSRFFRAILYGVPAAMLGSGIYYAIVALTDYEIGLVAILIGFMVGAAVRAASGPGGGRRFQLLAASLTYCAIVTTYVPFVIEGFRQAATEEAAAAQADALATASEVATDTTSPLEPGVEPVSVATNADEPPASIVDIAIAFTLVFAIAFVAPFLGGLENIIGILIIGFGVYQAWKMNGRLKLEITGPHTVGPQPVESA